MGLNHRSQSALEYMMTYGWAILVIVIVAAVLYSLGIFSPSSSLSTTVTGFANLGTVNAVCLGGTSFTISMGDSTGYPINVTEINLTSSSGKTTYSPNILIQPNSIETVTVPSASLCTSGARYSVSAVISYLEPGQIFPGPYTSTGTVAGTANSPPSSATSYETLNITNTQSQGTSSPFQQMINVTSTSPGWADISSSPFGQNVEFFSSTGQILDSWLENYTSTHAIWWVKLTSSIPAGSKQTIYMGFAPTSTNLFNNKTTGEAPQLSSTYAEYDDGSNVFYSYAGKSTLLSEPYTSLGPNGVFFDLSNYEDLISLRSPSSASLFTNLETYKILPVGDYWHFLVSSSTSSYYSGQRTFGNGNDFFNGYGPASLTIDGGFGNPSNYFNETIPFNYNFSNGISFLSIDNGQELGRATYNASLFKSGDTSIAVELYWNITVQYIAVTSLPPEGVMPSVSFGSVS